jgi:hypothetical protein
MAVSMYRGNRKWLHHFSKKMSRERPFRSSNCRRQDNMTNFLGEIGYENANWPRMGFNSRFVGFF